MTQLIAAIVDHGISAAAGIVATLLGFGVIRSVWLKSKPAWVLTLLKVGGPLLVLLSVAQIVIAVLKSR